MTNAPNAIPGVSRQIKPKMIARMPRSPTAHQRSAKTSLKASQRAGSNANRPVFPDLVAMIASCGRPIIRPLVVLDQRLLRTNSIGTLLSGMALSPLGSILVTHEPIDGPKRDYGRRKREQLFGCMSNVEDQELAHDGQQRSRSRYGPGQRCAAVRQPRAATA